MIAVKSGILKGLYSRNQFDLCPQKLLTLAQVNQEQSISLRSAVITESITGSQGFTKCLKLGYSVIAGVTIA